MTKLLSKTASNKPLGPKKPGQVKPIRWHADYREGFAGLSAIGAVSAMLFPTQQSEHPLLTLVAGLGLLIWLERWIVTGWFIQIAVSRLIPGSVRRLQAD